MPSWSPRGTRHASSSLPVPFCFKGLSFIWSGYSEDGSMGLAQCSLGAGVPHRAGSALGPWAGEWEGGRVTPRPRWDRAGARLEKLHAQRMRTLSVTLVFLTMSRLPRTEGEGEPHVQRQPGPAVDLLERRVGGRGALQEELKGTTWWGGFGVRLRNLPICWATLGRSLHLSGPQLLRF